MKVFDFDNTIYRGESSIDLALYMIRNDKKILLYVPMIFYNLVRYKLCLVSMEHMEAIINDFCASVMGNKEKMPEIIGSFWRSHARKLDPGIIRLIGPEDIIMTASPSMLINGIKDRLHTQNLICSEIDPETGKILYLNFKDNKAKRFKELYGNRRIDALYTDSYNDKALMEIADKVYIVKKGKITAL